MIYKAVEYAVGISEDEEFDSPNEHPEYDAKQSDGEAPGL